MGLPLQVVRGKGWQSHGDSVTDGKMNVNLRQKLVEGEWSLPGNGGPEGTLGVLDMAEGGQSL